MLPSRPEVGGTTKHKLIVIAMGALVLLFAAAQLPTTTRTRVDSREIDYVVPLYAKAIAFLDRDVQMRSLAERLVAGISDPEARAMRLLEWTHDHVRPVPNGFPVVDDHPYSILLRGYGTFDQAADAFANLAAYAGLRSKFVFSRNAEGGASYAFALVFLDGEWRVFDVREGRAFRTPTGQLAGLERLRTEPGLTAALAPPQEAKAADYWALFATIDMADHRKPTDQMPLERLLAELARLVGR